MKAGNTILYVQKITQHDSVFNEIAKGAMKSERPRMKSANADEIKSVLLPTKSDFITKRFHPTIVGFIPSERTDLVEKNPHLS